MKNSREVAIEDCLRYVYYESIHGLNNIANVDEIIRCLYNIKKKAGSTFEKVYPDEIL